MLQCCQARVGYETVTTAIALVQIVSAHRAKSFTIRFADITKRLGRQKRIAHQGRKVYHAALEDDDVRLLTAPALERLRQSVLLRLRTLFEAAVADEMFRRRYLPRDTERRARGTVKLKGSSRPGAPASSAIFISIFIQHQPRYIIATVCSFVKKSTLTTSFAQAGIKRLDGRPLYLFQWYLLRLGQTTAILILDRNIDQFPLPAGHPAVGRINLCRAP